MVKVKNDLTGQKFGHLTVIKQTDDYISPKRNRRQAQYLCRCDCGKELAVLQAHLKNGHTQSCGRCIFKDKSELVYGRGMIDVYEGMTTATEPAYAAWYSMMTRCYSEQYQKSASTYVGCAVCADWLKFSTFWAWFSENQWYDGSESVCVDKDIMAKGNRIYHPDACVLVPRSLNNVFTKNQAVRGAYPIGVIFCDKRGCFIARLSKNGKTYYLGSFETQQEAFNAYRMAKEEYIRNLADWYKEHYPQFPQKLYDAMCNYKVEITD